MNQEADMARSNQKLAFALLFFTFFIWGSIYVTGKMISDDVPASLVACLRCVTAMIPLYFMSRKHLKTKIDRKDRKYFFLVGALGYFLTVQMIQLGIALTGASMAALINAMTPVAVTILAAIILKEKITPVKCLCLVLALAGTIVITSGASTQGETMGIAVVLAGVVSFAAASVYMRRLTAKYPAVLVTTYSMAISLIFHIPVGIVTVCTRPVTITPLGVAIILYLGFAGSGVAQYTWTKCLSMLPASTCSLFYPLQPAFAALLGAWLLGETFTPAFFIGLMLISLDVVLNTWEARQMDKALTAKESSNA